MKRAFDLLRLLLGIGFVLMTSAVLIGLLICFLPWRKARITICNAYGHFISPVVLKLARARVKFEDRHLIDEAKPAIYVSNHTSMTDIFIGMWMLPFGGVGIAKKEVGNVPLYGWAYRLSGHLLIDRGNRERAIASMKALADTVRRYRLSIWMWPEGTRSRDGRFRPLKKGVAHLAIATGLPIVPVMVHGAHKNWILKTAFDFHETDVLIKVLPAIETRTWRTETLDQHLAELHAYMATALPPDQLALPDSDAGDVAV